METAPENSSRPDRDAEVVYLFAFDVANEIRLDDVESLLGARPLPFAIRPGRTVPRPVPLSRPLTVEPARPVDRVNGRPVRLRIRVFAVGVVSVSVRVAVGRSLYRTCSPSTHRRWMTANRLMTWPAGCAHDACRELSDRLVSPGPVTDPEAYTAFMLSDLGGETDANRWLAGRRREVAGLLTETPADRLSETQVAEVLRLRRSFENTDLVVIDWDAALVVDLDGSAEDVLFVLELANLQLEEFRWMDRSSTATWTGPTRTSAAGGGGPSEPPGASCGRSAGCGST